MQLRRPQSLRSGGVKGRERKVEHYFSRFLDLIIIFVQTGTVLQSY